jgi:hypothetical protein
MLFRVGILQTRVEMQPDGGAESQTSIEMLYEDFRPEQALVRLFDEVCNRRNKGRMFVLGVFDDTGRTEIAQAPIAACQMPPHVRDANMRELHQSIYRKILEMHLRALMAEEHAGVGGGLFARLLGFDGKREDPPADMPDWPYK